MEIYTPPAKISSKSSLNYRDNLKKEALERKKNILHLIYNYLIDNNLQTVATSLQNETQIGLQYQVCENIDLEIILQEYQSYYYTKYQKQPTIIRKIDNVSVLPIKSAKKHQVKKEQSQNESPIREPFEIDVVSLSNSLNQSQNGCHDIKQLYDNYSSELTEQITKQIIPKTLGISFKDCVSLDKTVETLKEAIVYPVLYPQLFEKIHSWKGVLLYGPPGTGKTLLAKALACESPTVFINVTSSSFVSKWRGESEKLLKELFDVAKFHAPCTIFIDEIDALASSHNDTNHEASRRFKSELLVQIDGIVECENVFILATTNSPWALDSALLRRFEKRIFVPLPDKQARFKIFRFYFHKFNYNFNKEIIDDFVNMTEGFSGSDLKVLCTEIEMIRIRERLKEIKSGTIKMNELRQVSPRDVIDSLKKIRPCIEGEKYKKYMDWGLKYGLN